MKPTAKRTLHRKTRQTSSIAKALQPFVDRRVLAGAVALVASREEILSIEAVGFSDIAAQARMPTDALFWIASQTKPLTAAALMMLVDEGEVNVDDPIEKHLPEFKGQMVTVEKDAEHVLLRKPSRPARVRDILSHTAGMRFCSPLEQPTLDGLPLRVAVASHALLPLLTDPGTKYQYANAGCNTAGRIIEVVSGIPYEAFMQQRLFDPLGLQDTTFWPSEAQVRRLAKTYKLNADGTGLEPIDIAQLRYPLSDRTRHPMPAGGLFATARDAARFCQMILNEGTFEGTRYLSRTAVKQMTSRQTPAKLPESYGFGWAVWDDGYGHGGAYSTSMIVDLKHELVLVFNAQHAGCPGDGNKSQEAFKQAAIAQFGTKTGTQVVARPPKARLGIGRHALAFEGEAPFPTSPLRA